MARCCGHIYNIHIFIHTYIQALCACLTEWHAVVAIHTTYIHTYIQALCACLTEWHAAVHGASLACKAAKEREETAQASLRDAELEKDTFDERWIRSGMCVRVCMYVYIYLYILCGYIYVYIYVYMCIYARACLRDAELEKDTLDERWIRSGMYVCIHVMYTHTHIYMCVYIYIHI